MRSRFILALVGLVAFAGTMTFQIKSKEEILSQGREIYLAIGPRDPRSLIQGDYMVLRYSEAAMPIQEVMRDMPYKGQIVLKVDDQNIATFSRLLTDDSAPPAPNELVINYRKSNGWRFDLRYTAMSYFFEEGKASHYEQARFIRVNVANDGTSLITGLADANRNPL